MDWSMAAQALSGMGYELVSTGGSAAAIEAAGLPVKRVEDLTGFPEMLDGACRMPYSTVCSAQMPLAHKPPFVSKRYQPECHVTHVPAQELFVHRVLRSRVQS